MLMLLPSIELHVSCACSPAEGPEDAAAAAEHVACA